MTRRRVEMLKKPGGPTLSSGFVGSGASFGRVVSMDVGTWEVGGRLKYVSFSAWGEVKSVTCRVT